MNRKRALGIFSGGLDSILAALVLRRQGIEVVALNWTTPFFGGEQARRSAAAVGVPLRVEDLLEHFLPLLSNPPHGFGKALNPCVDCHILMLREAGRVMEAEGFDFLFTGEVLGQRPFSQHRGALELIARESGYGDVVLRPLCARLLKATRPEREGWVDRERLLTISGRGRKQQLALANEWGIGEYPTPAGGCLLTDAGFSRRLQDLLTHGAPLTRPSLELLKWGRHFRLSPATKAIVGRNRGENEQIAQRRQPGDFALQTTTYPGPLVLAPGGSPEDLPTATTLCASYSDAPEGAAVEVSIQGPQGTTRWVAPRQSREQFQPLLL